MDTQHDRASDRIEVEKENECNRPVCKKKVDKSPHPPETLGSVDSMTYESISEVLEGNINDLAYNTPGISTMEICICSRKRQT